MYDIDRCPCIVGRVVSGRGLALCSRLESVYSACSDIVLGERFIHSLHLRAFKWVNFFFISLTLMYLLF